MFYFKAPVEISDEALHLKFWLPSNEHCFHFLKREKKSHNPPPPPHKKANGKVLSQNCLFFFSSLSCTNYCFSSLSAELVEVVLSAWEAMAKTTATIFDCTNCRGCEGNPTPFSPVMLHSCYGKNLLFVLPPKTQAFHLCCKLAGGQNILHPCLGHKLAGPLEHVCCD